jgi:hypothetical protein
MIIVKLMGGLGNQMFQYAAGRALSLKLGAELKLDLSWFNSSEVRTPREYMLGIFSFKQDFAAKSEVRKLKKREIPGPAGEILEKVKRKLIPFHKRHHIMERHCQFDPDIFKISGSVYLEGAWQTEKYFKDAEETIRRDFAFTSFQDNKNLEIEEKIKSSNSVSLHIRRGDYVNDSYYAKFCGGICETDYHIKAIDIAAGKIENPVFFIFSDDIEWARNNLPVKHPVNYIDWNSGVESYRDMHLMSMCRHNIIANSSFSWWGAWLNGNPGKIVIAPSRWFNNPDTEICDIIPGGWIKI